MNLNHIADDTYTCEYIRGIIHIFIFKNPLISSIFVDRRIIYVCLCTRILEENKSLETRQCFLNIFKYTICV